MKKSDLKSGMRVICRNGGKYIIVGDVMHNDNWDFIPMRSFDEKFRKLNNWNREWDIMEIHKAIIAGFPLDNSNFTKETLLWKRQELTEQDFSEQDKKVIESIKILKPDYKWIARNKDGKLNIFIEEPQRSDFGDYWFHYSPLEIDNKDLQCIQWEDDEPYHIQE